jgi:hypothetical protein
MEGLSMEIIKRASESQKFKVLRPFYWNGKTLKLGDVIEIKEQFEADGMVQRKMVAPADVPKTGIYIVLWPSLTLPGLKQKFEAKRLELVELTQDQAIDLMIQRGVIPKSEKQWRPGNAHLRKGDKKK